MKEVAEAGDKLVVIYFGATWCQPCNQMIPKVKELSKEEPNVVFLYVSTDKDEEAAEKFNITAQPTFVLLKKNKIMDKMVGTDIAKLKKLVEIDAEGKNKPKILDSNTGAKVFRVKK